MTREGFSAVIDAGICQKKMKNPCENSLSSSKAELTMASPKKEYSVVNANGRFPSEARYAGGKTVSSVPAETGGWNTETEERVTGKRTEPWFKKNGSVFPKRRRLVKTMILISLAKSMASLCSPASSGSNKRKRDSKRSKGGVFPLPDERCWRKGVTL